MCKKLGIGLLILAGAAFVWTKTNLGSYGHLAWKKAKTTVQNQVPLELEVERLRDEVATLVPDMNQHRSAIAAEKVAIEKLKKEIAVARANLKERTEEIRTMRNDLKANTAFVTYDGRRYARERVKAKLARDWESLLRCEEAVQSKERLLQIKEEALATAFEKLSEMQHQKEQLELRTAQLDTELKNLRVAQTRNEFHLDDSQLGRCRALLDEIQTRIEQERTLLDMQGQSSADLTIPVSRKVKTEKAMQEIDARFADAPSKVVEGN